MRWIGQQWIGLVLGAFFPAVTHGAVPANDDFTAAFVLVGNDVTTSGSNIGATKETGEPDHAGNAGGHSVWWSWTVPADGQAVIDTATSSFDTTLAVYAGTEVADLTPIASNDDEPGSRSSRVTFPCHASEVFRIAVDGYNDASGSIALHVAVKPPSNDDFANRTFLTGSEFVASGSNVGATKEAGEPRHAGAEGERSVWWSWTAPVDGHFAISVSAEFSVALAVYTGDALANLTLVASDSSSGASSVGFPIRAGTAYVIAVDSLTSWSWSSGSVELWGRMVERPLNDNFADAFNFPVGAMDVTGSNLAATAEPSEPGDPWQPARHSIWWNWTAPGDGVVFVDTRGSSLYTVVRVYTGETVSDLVNAVEDNATYVSPESWSWAMFPCRAGATYHIAVDGDGGMVQLHLAFGLAPPNDNLANATALAGPDLTFSAPFYRATRENEEPPGFHSVWYAWTAPFDGKARVDASGAFGTFAFVQVYTGTSIPELRPVALQEVESSGPTAIWRATNGVTYLLRVFGPWGGSSFTDFDFDLRLGLVPLPPNDDFETRIALDSTDITTEGSNVGATYQPSEPSALDQRAGGTVWWSWKSSHSGEASISTLGSDFDTMLAVYTGGSLDQLRWVAEDDDSGGSLNSRVVFPAVAGEVYQIVVSGFGGYSWQVPPQGRIQLRVHLGDPVAPPTGQSPAQLPKALFSLAGILTAVHTQPDGKVIIGGTFSAVNGQPRQNIARLNANGSLDLTWNVAVDGEVNVILMRGDSVFLAGAFTKVNGVGRAGLAKVQSSDGRLDEVWDPNPESATQLFAEWQKPFYALLAVGDFIYVSGDFKAIGGARRTGLAKLAIQGTGLADPNWNPRLTVADMPAPVVMTFAVVDDKLVIGGGFDRVNGFPRQGLAKLSLTGSGDLDPIWNPVLPRADASVQQVLVHGTNLIVSYFDANITSVDLDGTGITGPPAMLPRDTSVTFQAMALSEGGVIVIRNNDDGGATVFRLNFPDLTLAPSPWQAPIFQQGIRAVFSFYNAAQLNAATTRANRVLVGGYFNVVNGAPALGLAAIDPVTGESDPSFNVFVQRPGRVLTMARQPDGKLVAGGEFDTVDDLPRANLVRFNADGVVDPTWSPNPNGIVHTVLATESNLFVGGVFTNVTGSGKGHLVKFNYANDRPDPAWPASPEPIPLPATDLATTGGWLFELELNENENSSSLVVRDRNSGAIARKFEGDALALTPGPDGQVIVAGVGLHPGRGYELVRVDPQPPFAFDPNWNPSVQGGFSGAQLAVSGTNVFVASSDRIFKFPLSGSDLPSPGWQVPNVFSKSDTSSGLVQGIQALAVVGTNLFVGGTFWPIGAPVPPVGGNGKTMLARLDLETGAINALWNTGSEIPFGVRSLFADGHNLYIGGRFGRFGDDTRFALALLATPGAPTLFESAPDLVTILRNPDDGPEVTHFRIVALNGGLLQRISDSTFVLSGDFVTVADGQAGLRFLPGAGSPSVTAVSAVSPTPLGAGSAAATLDLQSALVPVFSFSQEEYRFSEANDSVTLTVLKQGLGSGSVRVSTSDGTASVAHFPEPGDYQGGSGRIMLAGTRYDFQITLVRDEIFEGDEVFYVTLSEPSPGARLGYPARARVVIVDDDRFGANGSFLARQLPTAPADSTGILAVYLKGDLGAWRLTGEWDWHGSGEMVSGLSATNYQVEFKPLSGYPHPDTQTIPITIGQINYVTNEYGGPQPSEQVGALTVIIDPAEIPGNPDPSSAPRWRLAGESDTAWRRSGEIAVNLSIGFHEITLKPLSNYFVHIPEPVVWVSAERTRTNYARYLPASGTGNVEPQVLTFTQATEGEPFCYNGQIKSRLGVGSGVVVKEGVVLTVAHLVFDDKNLEWVNALDIQWLFQHYRGQNEPVPQTPYGTVILTGYAAQRTNDMRDLRLLPGVSTLDSQNLDVALLFFLEPAGRGGFGGFLVSEDPNEHLLSSRRKMLVGYPKDGVPEINQGKPHATVPANLPFQVLQEGKSVYVTDRLRSLPGNSGGPLYVEAEGGGKYYPVAVYVGQTASGQSLVRAIDALVVDYINRVEELSRSGPNHPGGGFDPFIPGVTRQPIGTGLLTFELVPEAARAAGAGWRVRQNMDKTWVTNATLTYALTGGVDYDVEFRAAPAFITPVDRQVRVDIGEVSSLKLRYVRWPGEFELRNDRQVSLLGSNRGQYIIEYRTSLSLTDRWLPWATMTLTNSPMVFDLSVATNVAQRFFRMGLTIGPN